MKAGSMKLGKIMFSDHHKICLNVKPIQFVICYSIIYEGMEALVLIRSI